MKKCLVLLFIILITICYAADEINLGGELIEPAPIINKTIIEKDTDFTDGSKLIEKNSTSFVLLKDDIKINISSSTNRTILTNLNLTKSKITISGLEWGYFDSEIANKVNSEIVTISKESFIRDKKICIKESCNEVSIGVYTNLTCECISYELRDDLNITNIGDNKFEVKWFGVLDPTFSNISFASHLGYYENTEYNLTSNSIKLAGANTTGLYYGRVYVFDEFHSEITINLNDGSSVTYTNSSINFSVVQPMFQFNGTHIRVGFSHRKVPEPDKIKEYCSFRDLTVNEDVHYTSLYRCSKDYLNLTLDAADYNFKNNITSSVFPGGISLESKRDDMCSPCGFTTNNSQIKEYDFMNNLYLYAEFMINDTPDGWNLMNRYDQNPILSLHNDFPSNSTHSSAFLSYKNLSKDSEYLRYGLIGDNPPFEHRKRSALVAGLSNITKMMYGASCNQQEKGCTNLTIVNISGGTIKPTTTNYLGFGASGIQYQGINGEFSDFIFYNDAYTEIQNNLNDELYLNTWSTIQWIGYVEYSELSNYTFDNSAPEKAGLMYPINKTTISDNFTIEFVYNVTDVNILDVLSCDLLIDNKINITNTTLYSGDEVRNFIVFNPINRSINWSVNCSDWETSTMSDMSYLNITDELPSQVSGMGYSATNSIIYLVWNANPEADVIQYYVYYSTELAGSYAFLNNVSSLGYTHTGLAEGTTHYYKVSAKDTQNNYGKNSSILTAGTTGAGTIVVIDGSGGGGGGGSFVKNVSECSVYIKRPSNRIIIMKQNSPTDIYNGTFEICNQDNVPVMFHYYFDSNLNPYCQLSEESYLLSGNTCRTISFQCNTPEKATEGRILINRDSFDNEVLTIPGCENNIVATIGYFSLLDIWKITSGTWFYPSLVLIPSLFGTLIYLIIKLMRK